MGLAMGQGTLGKARWVSRFCHRQSLHVKKRVRFDTHEKATLLKKNKTMGSRIAMAVKKPIELLGFFKFVFCGRSNRESQLGLGDPQWHTTKKDRAHWGFEKCHGSHARIHFQLEWDVRIVPTLLANLYLSCEKLPGL